MFFFRASSLLIGFLLAGCSTPYEACSRAALREVATLDRLIGAEQAALGAGYRLGERQDLVTSYGPCDDRDLGDEPYCQYLDTSDREIPLAADPAAAERRLARLTQRRAEVTRRAYRDWLRCQQGR